MDVELGEVSQGGVRLFGESDNNGNTEQSNHKDTEDGAQETQFGREPLAAAGIDQVDIRHLDPTERKPLMGQQTSNKETEDNEKESQSPSKEFCISCTKEDLTAEVCWKIPVWLIMVFLVVVIVCVIIGTLALCAAIHVDEDDEFDRSLFRIPHYFNGSINLPPNRPYNKSQVSADLQQKLTDLYRSSHTLGRYFSTAEIFALRNASVEYQLTFVLPKEEQEELRNFTLSREMVRNVFRQFLYDQDPVRIGGMPVDKASLKVSPVYMVDFHEQTDEDR